MGESQEGCLLIRKGRSFDGEYLRSTARPQSSSAASSSARTIRSRRPYSDTHWFMNSRRATGRNSPAAAPHSPQKHSFATAASSLAMTSMDLGAGRHRAGFAALQWSALRAVRG